MKSKGLLLFFLVLTTFLLSGLSIFGATLSPALSVISHSLELNIDGLVGNDLTFSKSYFKSELGSDLLGKVKVSSLPNEDFGTLSIGDTPLTVGDIISPASLDKLVFSPKRLSKESGSFTVSVTSCGINYDVTCNIHMLEILNMPPCAAQARSELSAFSGVCAYGLLEGSDPDGDNISFEISTYPKKGSLILTDSKKGRYVYTPNESASGKDSFEYTVVDCYGNRSLPTEVCINLTDIEKDNIYTDMSMNPAATSATLLSEMGIFQGERIGGKLVFYPEKEVTREEFLRMALTWSSIEPIKNIGDLPYTKTAASLGIISNNNTSFDDIITLSEAAQIAERLAINEEIKDEYVFSPFDSPEESLERLVFTTPELFHLENIPQLPLSRKNAVSIVTNCIPRG